MYKKTVIHLLFAILATASFNTAAQCAVTAHPPPPFPAGLPTDLPKHPIVDARDIDWPDTPYMDGRILRTIKRQGVLPSAVPSPVATNERYFRYVRVTPATVKLWRIGPESVEVFGGTDPFEHVSFEKQFFVKESGYSVAMTVRDKSRFGLMQYTDTLSLAIGGIEEPGILEVPRWVRMKPSVNPDQQTFTSNYYDLARHPELSRITVSANLQARDLWPLGCFGTILPCLFILLPIYQRTRILSENERRQELMRAINRWMVGTYALMLLVFSVYYMGLVQVLSMWFSPDDVKWARDIPIMVNLVIPYAVYAITKSVLFRAVYDMAQYPELQRLKVQMNVVFWMSLISCMVLFSMTPDQDIVVLLTGITLFTTLPYVFTKKYERKLHMMNLKPLNTEEDARLRLIQDRATTVLAPKIIQCPSILLVYVPMTCQEPIADTATKQLTISCRAIETLDDDELHFLICQHLIRVGLLDKQKGSWVISIFAMVIPLTLIWSVIMHSSMILMASVIIVWLTTRYMGMYIQRWADKLTVEMIDNRGVAISALSKMEQNTVGEGLFALRRKSLEELTCPA